MARIKLEQSLKDAISELPDKEKNKLLYRLIAKDYMLVEQLKFKLLDNSETTEERRGELHEMIDEILVDFKRFHFSPGYLMMELRTISGQITEHVRITKDKFGEIELNLHMIRKAFEEFEEHLKYTTDYKARKLTEYIIKRMQKLIKLIEKLHEDYYEEFREDLGDIATYIDTIPVFVKSSMSLKFRTKELREI